MNGKNVVIATWYGPANYGTALQAVALKHYLECKSFNVEFLEDYRKTVNSNKTPATQMINKIKKVFNPFFWYKLPYRKKMKIKMNLQSEYVKKYTKTFCLKSKEDIEKINKFTDIFISGGDQIWNPYVFTTGFMLDFVNDDKLKISYGTSVGVKEIPSQFSTIYNRLLSRYKAISVRENQSANALYSVINKEVAIVLDPTMLLTGEEWSFLLEDAHINPAAFDYPYILCYFVGTRKTYWDYVGKMRNKTGYQVIVIPINDEAYKNKFRKCIEVSPAEFLWLIKNAAIVCTDSFHATIFSILFGKEFYTLKRFLDNSKESQNGRLEDLLSRYELKNRLIGNESTFTILEKIDYATIYENIEQERVISKQWLENALKK